MPRLSRLVVPATAGTLAVMLAAVVPGTADATNAASRAAGSENLTASSQTVQPTSTSLSDGSGTQMVAVVDEQTDAGEMTHRVVRYAAELDASGHDPRVSPTRATDGEPLPRISAAEALAWTVTWPTATVTEGATVSATITLAPGVEPYRFELQQYTPTGGWVKVAQESGSGLRVLPFDIHFALPTNTPGTSEYRIRQVDPVPEVDSAIFTFTVNPKPTPTPDPKPDPDPKPKPKPKPKRATKMALFSPTARDVRVTKTVKARGWVSGGTRKVQLQIKTTNGWRHLRGGWSGKRGYFTYRLPTGWYGTHRFRAVAPATKTHKQATSPSRIVKVRPGYRPTGNPRGWNLIAPGVRWNPCKVINYKLNLRGAPPGAARRVHKAFWYAKAATGLSFRYAGRTNKVPFSGKPNQFEDGTIIVAWSTPKTVPDLRRLVIGVGGSAYMTRYRGNSRISEYVYGGVVLDSTDSWMLPHRFGKGVTEGNLLLHEIGHALGLHHTNSKGQEMYPSMDDYAPANYGRGDLNGLLRLGAVKGCIK